MRETLVDIEYIDIDENKEYESLIIKVMHECFSVENLLDTNIYIDVTLTNPKTIREMNKAHRDIDKETDVLSFPMFEKEEIPGMKNLEYEETLGDIVISLDRVKEQAEEYGHSFERELAYMLVHGFYHLMGEDHMVESDKEIMREKEEYVLNRLSILRYVSD